MPKWEMIQVAIASEELPILEEAAGKAGLSLPVYLKNVALMAAHQTVKRRNGRELVWIYREAASRGHIWTEEELKVEGLPLYWSEQWIRQRLAEGHTINQIAVMTGSPITTIRNHIEKHFGINLGRRQLSAEDIQNVRTRFEQGETRQAIAQDYRISRATLSKYLRDQPTTYEVESIEAIQRTQPELSQPPIEMEQPWHVRHFLQQIAAVYPWPASIGQIAQQLFDGNRPVARQWAYKHTNDERLVRVEYGVYDLNERAPSKSSKGEQ